MLEPVVCLLLYFLLCCGNVTINGEGLQNLGLFSAPVAFWREEISIVPHLLWLRTSITSSLKTSKVYWRTITSWILTGMSKLKYFACYNYNTSIVCVSINVQTLRTWTLSTFFEKQDQSIKYKSMLTHSIVFFFWSGDG